MNVGYDNCEFGAPNIDPKRPYGNSDVIEDIKEICSSEKITCPHCSEEIYNMSDEQAKKLHEDMKTVLQIILCVGKSETGIYCNKDDYDNSYWKLEGD